tara:strand:+ start:133 stop:417 length:285 start_codon:yes stop_codon:yes gene_type:complete
LEDKPGLSAKRARLLLDLVTALQTDCIKTTLTLERVTVTLADKTRHPLGTFWEQRRLFEKYFNPALVVQFIKILHKGFTIVRAIHDIYVSKLVH